MTTMLRLGTMAKNIAKTVIDQMASAMELNDAVLFLLKVTESEVLTLQMEQEDNEEEL
jgi:hypothetical protein